MLLILILLQNGCQFWRRTGVSSASTIASRQYVQQAVDAIQLENHSEATQKLALALKANPDNYEARAMYADTLWENGDVENGILEMQRVVQHEDATAEMFLKLAWMYYETEEWGLAQKYLNQGLQQNSTLADAWVLQGKIFQKQNDSPRAIAAFHQAIYYNPEESKAALYLADEYLLTQRPQRALETIQVALSKFPPSQEPVEMLYREGLAMSHLKRHADAVEILTAATEKMAGKQLFSPEDEQKVLLALAEAQYQAGRYADAIHTAFRGLEVGPYNQRCAQLVRQIQEKGITADVQPQIGGSVAIPTHTP
ncbi:MAG: tetratricopeptide repeat protein [Planctomycetia bacterium]|nr:tetratricopeptide repeat protein [Planctomycetia bacterium]